MWTKYNQILMTSGAGILRRRTPLNLYSPSRKASREHLNFLKEKRHNRPANFKDTTEKVGLGGYLLLGLPVTAFGLGCWQVQRKQWKEGLIKTLEERTKLAPVPIPENLNEVDTMEYERIIVRGEFLHDKEMLMGPRSMITDGNLSSEQGGGLMTQKQDTIGFHVITPLKLEGREEIILVNRGWVPARNKKPTTRIKGQIEGIVEIEGVVRMAEARPQFTPDHRENLYFYRDFVKMCKVSGAEPIFIDACYNTTVHDGPIGGQTRISLRNEHMSYIFTWFSLSAFTGWLWYFKIFRRIMKKKL